MVGRYVCVCLAYYYYVLRSDSLMRLRADDMCSNDLIAASSRSLGRGGGADRVT